MLCSKLWLFLKIVLLGEFDPYFNSQTSKFWYETYFRGGISVVNCSVDKQTRSTLLNIIYYFLSPPPPSPLTLSPLTLSPSHPSPLPDTCHTAAPQVASCAAVQLCDAATSQLLRNFGTSRIAEPWVTRLDRTGWNQEQSPLSSSLCLSLKNDDHGKKRESSSVVLRVLKSLKHPESVDWSLGWRSEDDLPLRIRGSHF